MHARLWGAAKHSQSLAVAGFGIEAEYDSMHALVDAAFAFEAYMQYLGARFCDNWESVERKSFRERIKKVAQALNVDANFGSQPFSDIKLLVSARDSIAHARPQYSTIEKVVEGCAMLAFAMDKGAQIERLCTNGEVKRFLGAVEKAIGVFYEASGDKIHPLYVHGVTAGIIRQ